MKKILLTSLALTALLMSCKKEDIQKTVTSSSEGKIYQAEFNKTKSPQETYEAPDLSASGVNLSSPTARVEASQSRIVTILVRDVATGYPAIDKIKVRIYRLDDKGYFTTPKKYTTNYKELKIVGSASRRYVIYAEDINSNIGASYVFTGSIQNDTTVNLTVGTDLSQTPDIRRVSFKVSDNYGYKVNYVKNNSGDKINMILTDNNNPSFIIPIPSYNASIGLASNSNFSVSLQDMPNYDNYIGTFNFSLTPKDSVLNFPIVLQANKPYPTLNLSVRDTKGNDWSIQGYPVFITNNDTNFDLTLTSHNFSQALPWGSYSVKVPSSQYYFQKTASIKLKNDTSVTVTTYANY